MRKLNNKGFIGMILAGAASALGQSLGNSVGSKVDKAINPQEKIPGVPTPEEKGPEKLGDEERIRLQHAYPELTPWERAGQGGAMASVSSANTAARTASQTASAEINKAIEMQKREQSFGFRLKMAEMANQQQIVREQVKGQLLGQYGVVGFKEAKRMMDYYNGKKVNEEGVSDEKVKAQISRDKYGVAAPAVNISREARDAFINGKSRLYDMRNEILNKFAPNEVIPLAERGTHIRNVEKLRKAGYYKRGGK